MYKEYLEMADALEKLASTPDEPTLEDVAAASLMYLNDSRKEDIMDTESMRKVADQKIMSDLAFEYGMAIVMNAVTNL